MEQREDDNGYKLSESLKAYALDPGFAALRALFLETLFWRQGGLPGQYSRSESMHAFDNGVAHGISLLIKEMDAAIVAARGVNAKEPADEAGLVIEEGPDN